MRKINTFLLIATAVFLFNINPVQADTVDIGLAWAGKSGMAKRVSKGFEEAISEYSKKIKIEYQKELGSVDDLAVVAKKWQTEKKAMVLLRSNAAKWLGKNQPSIPTFIGGCNNPAQLGALKNLEAPEGMITGVTYFLPVETQFEIFTAILPNMKSILLLLEKGHPSSVIDQEGTKAVCKKLGIQYSDKLCASKEDIIQAVSEAKDKVSAIIIGNQAVLMDNTKNIVNAAGNMPVVSYSSKPVKDGALGGFVADDVKLGQMLAKSVVDVMLNKKSVKNTPVKVDPEPNFFINIKTAEKLGIEIPYTILETATVIE
jgi:putative tryptophan/tyrosine transport system substrate-binding protein